MTGFKSEAAAAAHEQYMRGVMVCKEGFTSSMHLVEKKANELRAAIRKQAANTFREIQQLEAEAMCVPGPIHDC
jgi:ribose 5-phosphate isomerase RpiB